MKFFAFIIKSYPKEGKSLASKTDLILPNSEYWGEHELSIPLHENLKLKNVKKISDIIYANALQKIN